MKINFDWQSNPFVKKDPNPRSGVDIPPEFLNRQTVLDISGKVTDDFSYGDQGRYTRKVTEAAKAEDYVALQRNFNAIMSNSMSGKDFLAMEKEGFDVYSLEPEEIVTILDEIKINLARSGEQITGYNDDLTLTQLEEATGSSSHAGQIAKALKQADVPVTQDNLQTVEEALEKALSLKTPEEGSIAGLLRDGLEPTLGNLYKAGFSSINIAHRPGNSGYATGSYTRQGENLQDIRKMKVTEEDIDKLNEQLAKRIEESGLTADERHLKDARWLVENGFPVDEEHLKLYGRIRELALPPDVDTVIRQAAQALAEGRDVWDIPLSPDITNIYERAADLYDRYQKLPPEAADYAYEHSFSMTLQNMEGYFNVQGSFSIHIQARKTLEEVRLKMTAEANLRLLRSGVSIDTTPMEDLIAYLDAAQKEHQQVFSDSGELYVQTLKEIKELPQLPLAVVGRIPFMNHPTLGLIGQEGRNLQREYEAAASGYEALMTAPRKDMGDSIRKAFRNVDELLQEMELEATEANRRAVRILGYNRMEINEENLWKVKEADRSVQDVITGMKPGVVLDMIRKGKNPLEMSLDELQEYLSEPEQDFADEAGEYSKFLYKLEKQGGIDADERKAFIGIYRLFRQIEKSDGAVVGSLVAQGAELNFSNLLSAVRTRKFGHMDVRADESLGFLQDTETKGISISTQIEEGFRAIREALGMGQSMEEAFRQMEQLDRDEAVRKEFAEEQLAEIRKILENKGNGQEYLRAYGQPITLDNLQSVGFLTGQRGSTFRRIRTLEDTFLKEQGEETEGAKPIRFMDHAIRFVERMEEPEERTVSYREMIEEAGQVLENTVHSLGNEAGYVDIKEIRQLYKQLNLAAELAKEENYEIPVQIGEEITSINLKIIHNRDMAGEVKITMDTEETGKVEARFVLFENSLEGSVLTEYMDKKDQLENRADALTEALTEALEETKIEIRQLLFQSTGSLNLNTIPQGEKAQHVDTTLLYRVAKGFITFIQNTQEGQTYEN